MGSPEVFSMRVFHKFVTLAVNRTPKGKLLDLALLKRHVTAIDASEIEGRSKAKDNCLQKASRNVVSPLAYFASLLPSRLNYFTIIFNLSALIT